MDNGEEEGHGVGNGVDSERGVGNCVARGHVDDVVVDKCLPVTSLPTMKTKTRNQSNQQPEHYSSICQLNTKQQSQYLV